MTSSDDNEITKLKEAEKKFKKRDKIGIIGESLATAAVGVSSWFGASTIAGLLGANVVTSAAVPATLFGSSWLAGSTGVASTVAVAATVSTPIGWAIGITTGITAAAYGLIRLVRSGGINDKTRKEIAQEIRTKIHELERNDLLNEDKIQIVISLVQDLMDKKVWAKEKGDTFIQGVKLAEIEIEFAITTLKGFANECENIKTADKSKSPEEIQKNSTSAHVFTVLKKTVNAEKEGVNNVPDDEYIKEMEQKYDIAEDKAIEIYKEAPVNQGQDAALIAKEFSQIFSSEVVTECLESLQRTSVNMAQGQQAFMRYVEMEKEMQAQLDLQLKKMTHASQKMKSSINRI